MMTTIFSLLLLLKVDSANPPGTIKVKDYYVDKTEVTNLQWLEYRSYRSREIPKSDYATIQPDSANFWYTFSINAHKPIVLVSYEQAVEYCAWRSKALEEFYDLKVHYRLPTPDEWKDIAKAILTTDRLQIDNEIKNTKKAMRKEAGQYFVAEVVKPQARVYHFFDNVSEMTAEKGIAMGGNNFDLMDLQTSLNRFMTYKAPNAYLGFRCVAEWVNTDPAPEN